jgi:predicted lipoprotein with Yx(FWY)xxD motif
VVITISNIQEGQQAMTKPDPYKAVAGGSRRKATVKAAVLGLAAVAVVAGLIGGGYAVFHGGSSPKKATSSATKTTPRDNTSPTAQTDPQNIVASDTPPVTNAVITTHSYASLGQYLADPNGTTLYTYNKDTSGTSNCSASCLATWPMYEDTGATTGLPANVTAIKRADTGTYQYAYKGAPLYFYTGDEGSDGGTTGNGLNGFYIAKP